MDSAVANLLARLETVTARLESVEKQLASGGGASSQSSSGASSSSSGASSAAVSAYEALIAQYITPYVDLSGKVGAPEVAQQAALLQKAVNAQLDMLRIASQSKKPSADVLNKLIKPTADAMNEISTFRDKNRASKAFNHLSTISEGVPALGWVLVEKTPAPHVGESRGSSEFYSNKILKDYKGKEQVHVDWVNSFNGFLKDLQAFVKQYHTTGLEWNAKGGDASNASASSSSSSSAAPSGPPPPPAPVVDNSKPAAAPVDSSKLFAELSKGTDVTKGLKKVTNDMKAKNRPESEKSSVVKAIEPKAEKLPAATGKAAVTKPPKFALEGSKWTVEFQNGARDLVISDTEPRQTLYLYKCVNTTIQVKGKINAITMDSCSRTSVVFESLVSTMDIVNCNSVEAQVTGKVPSMSVDKTSGCQLYIGKDALDTEIFTSKSDQMNVLIPGATPEDDLVEIALPEQYHSTIKNGKVITEPNTHV